MRGGVVKHQGWVAMAAFSVAVALALLPAAPALAQVSNSGIEVQVADDQGLPLPGVSVQAINTSTGLTRTMVTATDGTARILALPPGTYTVKFELAGFAPLEEAKVPLRVGQTAKLIAQMTLAKTQEMITVTAAAPVVDVTKMDSSTNIVPEQIESLPVPDRQFERLAFIAPGVERERGDYRFIKGGPVIGASGNASQSTILVDGVDLTDPALGLARARISQDAIREFRVINNRFDTEIGGSAGGALSIVTKSGGNELQGSVFGFYRNDSMRNRGALETGKVPYNRGQYGFTLGGPIVKDKTHFFLSGEYIDENNIALFRPQGAFASQAADIKHPFTQTLGFLSLDHSFSDDQRLTAKLVYEKYKEENFRVGGVADQSWGQTLKRDNYNVTLEHVLTASTNFLNELRFQAGHREYSEPTNSNAMEEWFSSGNTLKTGSNTVGDLYDSGDLFELRETAHVFAGPHEVKMGFGVQRVEETYRQDTFQEGLMLYLTDSRAIPLAYSYGVGSSQVDKSTTIYSGFVQDDWRLGTNVTISAGIRYDYDTQGNNPDFHHTLVPNGRPTDSNNIQPRVGFTWDISGDGTAIMRGGAGRFTGRYLLIPALIELQQNGESGRPLFSRVNGALYWPACVQLGYPLSLCQALYPALDPADPTHTGILSKPQIALLDKHFVAPQADQQTLGFTQRIGDSGMFFDVEAQHVTGTNEIVVRDTNATFVTNPATGRASLVRPNTAYDQINTYTNEGHSEYKALVLSVNGTLAGGHFLTAAITFADKKNISDDFSPVFPYGYPNDPSNIAAEWGPSQGQERLRIVASGVFLLGYGFTLAPTLEFGTGQPWNQRLGYDYNGDGKNSDRPLGVGRNSMDGPEFRQVNLRITKAFKISSTKLEVIAEAFNLFDTTNYDVTSIDTALYLSGPTLLNPSAAYVKNPNYGKYSTTLTPRTIQLGLRYTF
jgi:hypothetical protein